MKKAKLLHLSLQRFADGGEAGAAPGDTAEAVGTENQESTQASLDESQDAVGKEPPKRNLKQEFRDLIKGEYKDIYQAETQRMINSRFKETKALQDQGQKLQPVVQLLAMRYGVEANDLDALVRAVESDDGIYEAEAMNSGMSVEQIRHMKNIELENRMLKQSEAEKARQEDAARTYAAWAQQSEQTKAFYPDFDFDAELQENPQFQQLIGAGVDVKAAYEVAHKDEIFTRVAQAAARTAEKKTVDNIKAKGARPAENGISSPAGGAAPKDVSKLTDAEIDDYIRRAKQGETISFNT